MSVISEAIAFWEAQDLAVFDGEPPSAPPAAYLCVYTDDGTLTAESLTAQPSRADWALRTMSVGTTAEQARWVRTRAKRIVGQVIGGCVVTHEFANPMAADDDIPGSLIAGYDQFAVTATP